MRYSETIKKHFIRAMKIEVERLSEVYERVGDEWPPWFDANDIPLFDGMIYWLENLDAEDEKNDYRNSKPYSFMMECVSRYVNENITNLSDIELNEIISFWTNYAKRDRTIY